MDRVDIIWHGRRFYSTLLAMRMRGYRAADGRQICARWHIAKAPRGRQQEKRRPSAEPPFVVRHDRAAMIASQFCDPRNANDMPKSRLSVTCRIGGSAGRRVTEHFSNEYGLHLTQEV